jgi:tRNA (guanine-N7-)-methyltransferase
MGRTLKYDIPGPDWRVTVDDVRAKGWEEQFAGHLAAPLRLVVEIGFGRGEFLLELAGREPGVAHVGVEYSYKRVLKMARRLARTQLANVRLLQAPGELVLEELLDEGSVQDFWINFPDPWPKKRHQRRRFLNSPRVSDLATRLVPGGALHVATDHVGYAEAIDAALRGESLLENLHAPEPFLREVAGRCPTAYELEWRREGRSLHFFTYRRRSALAVDGRPAGS